MQICNVRRCHLHGRSAAVHLDSREFKTRTGSVRGCRHSYSQSQRQRHPSGDYLADTPVPLLFYRCVGWYIGLFTSASKYMIRSENRGPTARPGTTLDKEVLQRDQGSMIHDPALHALLHIRTINSVFLLPVHPDYEKWSQHTSISGNTQAAGTLECWR